MNGHKLIPQNLKGESSLFSQLPVVGDLIGDKSFKDVSFAMTPAALGLLIWDALAPGAVQQYSLVVAGILVFIGVGLLLAIPNYTQLSSLLRDIRQYKKRPTEMRFRNPDAHSEQAIDRPFYETDNKTQELTHVKNIIPNHGAIERQDGTIVGAVKIEPTNMVTATGQDWNQATQGFAGFLNNNLDFPIQIYGTTNHIDTDKFLQQYRERASDPEIASNPIMSRYIQHYVDVNEEIAMDRYLREYYIIVPVSKYSVNRGGADEGLDLTQFPLIGDILGMITDTATASKKGPQELKQRQLQELDDRRNVIENEMASAVQGCQARVLSSGEYAILLKEFWSGESMSHKDVENFIRSKPLVMGSVDAQKASSTQRMAENEE